MGVRFVKVGWVLALLMMPVSQASAEILNDSTLLSAKARVCSNDFPVSKGMPATYMMGLDFIPYGIADATDLWRAIPYIDGLSMWDETKQHFVEYDPVALSGNFAIEVGDVYRISVYASSSITLSGLQVRPQTKQAVNRSSHSMTNVFPIVISGTPIYKDAGSLMAAMPELDQLSYWDEENQQYVTYIGKKVNSFPIVSGRVYFASITNNTSLQHR